MNTNDYTIKIENLVFNPQGYDDQYSIEEVVSIWQDYVKEENIPLDKIRVSIDRHPSRIIISVSSSDSESYNVTYSGPEDYTWRVSDPNNLLYIRDALLASLR